MIKICYPFVGDSIGGSHKSALLLIKNLDKKKFNPMVVLHCEGILSKYLKKEEIEYQILPISNLAGSKPSIINIFFSIIKSFFKIKKFIKKNNIDIVHSNDLRCNLTWGLVSKIYAKHIWHQRTILSNSRTWYTIGFFTNQVICISNTVRNTYKSFAKVITLYNPFKKVEINKSEARKRLIKKINIPLESTIIGYVGRLTQTKGFDKFLNMSRHMPKSIFLAIGHNKNNFQSKNNIYYFGQTDDIESILASLDVLIAPSNKDGFGRVLVESMLVETPVIASDIPAHREVTENGKYAFISNFNNFKKISNQIKFLLSDSKKKKDLISSAKKNAIIRFSLDQHINTIKSIYLKLYNKNEII